MDFDQKPLEDLVRDLPPDSRQKVRQFVETLLENTRERAKKRLKQNWAGALSDYREEYTSSQLQQKSLEWRGD
jgi:mRNA-degrading endonuclease RelE of RelBE toxin-antitoxin system